VRFKCVSGGDHTAISPHTDAAVMPLDTQLMNEITRIRKLASYERGVMEHVCKDRASAGAGRDRSLFLVLRDLLAGSVAGDVLDTICKREIPLGSTRTRLSHWSAVVTVTVLSGSVLGMIAFVSIFLAQQPVLYRRSLGVSLAMWFIVDTVFVSTSTITTMQLLIPMSILSHVKQARATLVRHMKGDAPDSSTFGSYPQEVVGYLVVSHRLAHMLPSCPLLSLITNPTSHRLLFPVSYRLKHNPYFLLRLANRLTVWFMGLPSALQNIFVAIVFDAVWALVIIVHFWLYLIHPLIAILPSFLVVLVIHFLTRSLAHKHRLDKMTELGVDCRSQQMQPIIARAPSNVKNISSMVDFLMGSSTSEQQTPKDLNRTTGKLQRLISSSILGKNGSSLSGRRDESGSLDSGNVGGGDSGGSMLRRVIMTRVLSMGKGLVDEDDSDNGSGEEDRNRSRSGSGSGGWGWKSAISSLMMNKPPQEGRGAGEGAAATTGPEGFLEVDAEGDSSTAPLLAVGSCPDMEAIQSHKSLEEYQSTLSQELDEHGEPPPPVTYVGVEDVLELNMPAFLDLEESNFAFESSESDAESVSGRRIEIRNGEAATLDGGSCISFLQYEDLATSSIFTMQAPLFVVNTDAQYMSGESDDADVAATHEFDRICKA
jgi:hypothetical protein